MREAEKKRLIELLKCAREEMSKMFREKVEECLAKKGSFNSKTDADRQSIYELEADYLLDNGVIVLPCKVGDVVYWLDNGKIKSDEVFEISIHSDGILVHTGIQFCLSQVFLSEAEAKYALKNRRSVSLVNGHIEE